MCLSVLGGGGGRGEGGRSESVGRGEGILCLLSSSDTKHFQFKVCFFWLCHCSNPNPWFCTWLPAVGQHTLRCTRGILRRKFYEQIAVHGRVQERASDVQGHHRHIPVCPSRDPGHKQPRSEQWQGTSKEITLRISADKRLFHQPAPDLVSFVALDPPLSSEVASPHARSLAPFVP